MILANKLIRIEHDNFSHLNMEVTLNGDFLLFGITMSTALVYCWVLKDGILYPALEKSRVHLSLVNYM